MINSNFLDDAYALLLQQDVHKGMDILNKGLRVARLAPPLPRMAQFCFIGSANGSHQRTCASLSVYQPFFL
jgi:hypothetical protein